MTTWLYDHHIIIILFRKRFFFFLIKLRGSFMTLYGNVNLYLRSKVH